ARDVANDLGVHRADILCLASRPSAAQRLKRHAALRTRDGAPRAHVRMHGAGILLRICCLCRLNRWCTRSRVSGSSLEGGGREILLRFGMEFSEAVLTAEVIRLPTVLLGCGALGFDPHATDGVDGKQAFLFWISGILGGHLRSLY